MPEGEIQTLSAPMSEAIKVTEKQRSMDTYVHAIVVIFVLLSATLLRIRGELDTATISTVYGAILGYATGLTATRQRNGYMKG